MKTITLLLFLFFSGFILCQSSDPKLEVLYSKKELAQMTERKIELLNYALKEGVYYTTSSTKGEISNLPKIHSIDHNKTFVDYGIKIANSNQYFAVHGTNELMVVKSWFVLENELKNKK